jgi:hypothetical protein
MMLVLIPLHNKLENKWDYLFKELELKVLNSFNLSMMTN